jgi:hypothetical protein
MSCSRAHVRAVRWLAALRLGAHDKSFDDFYSGTCRIVFLRERCHVAAIVNVVGTELGRGTYSVVRRASSRQVRACVRWMSVC